MNAQFTIHVKPTGVTVLAGKTKGARDGWHAPGLDVYILGRVTKERRDDVHWHAMNICQGLHIPLISFKAVGRIVSKKEHLEQNADGEYQRGLFE